jgi:hypothetical protein
LRALYHDGCELEFQVRHVRVMAQSIEEAADYPFALLFKGALGALLVTYTTVLLLPIFSDGGTGALFVLHNFVDHDLAALVYGHHAMNTLEPGHGDVNRVIPRVQIKRRRGRLVSSPSVDRDLGTLGFGFDAHNALARRLPAPKYLSERADHLYFVGMAQSAQAR